VGHLLKEFPDIVAEGAGHHPHLHIDIDIHENFRTDIFIDEIEDFPYFVRLKETKIFGNLLGVLIIEERLYNFKLFSFNQVPEFWYENRIFHFLPPTAWCHRQETIALYLSENKRINSGVVSLPFQYYCAATYPAIAVFHYDPPEEKTE